MSKKIGKCVSFKGLTVTERLHVAGHLERFDDAARQRDREQMISMLQKVELTEQTARRWVDTVLLDKHFFYNL